MKTISLWLGIIAIFCLGHVLPGGHLRYIVLQPFVALTVFGPQLCFLLYCYGVKGSGTLFSRVVAGQIKERDMRFFQSLRRFTLLSVSLSIVSSAMILMGNLDDMVAVGQQSMSILVAICYGLIQSILTYPIKFNKGESNALAEDSNANIIQLTIGRQGDSLSIDAISIDENQRFNKAH